MSKSFETRIQNSLMMSIKVSNAKLVKFSYHPLNAGNISQAKMKRVVDHKMSQH
jgi:hypothetical protein